MIEDNRIMIAMNWSCHINGFFKYLRDNDILSNGSSRKILLNKAPEETANYVVATDIGNVVDTLQQTGRAFQKYMVSLNFGTTMPDISAGQQIYNMLNKYGIGDRFVGLTTIPGCIYQANNVGMPCKSYLCVDDRHEIVDLLKN